MKVFKKINNNVAFCYDASGNELIAFGKGIGFPSIPYELHDLTKIDRTYYDVDMGYLELLSQIPPEIFEVCAMIVDTARIKIKAGLNDNLLFTLADHVNFAIERAKKGFEVKNPLLYDIEYMYPDEMEVGKYALQFIERECKVALPPSEAANIAMHLINSEGNRVDAPNCENDQVIEHVTQLIETYYGMLINRKNFNYARFVSHMQYLLHRKDSKQQTSSENEQLYEKVGNDFPKTKECAEQIRQYFQTTLRWNPNEEEILYLMLHINRLCTREDCNR